MSRWMKWPWCVLKNATYPPHFTSCCYVTKWLLGRSWTLCNEHVWLFNRPCNVLLKLKRLNKSSESKTQTQQDALPGVPETFLSAAHPPYQKSFGPENIDGNRQLSPPVSDPSPPHPLTPVSLRQTTHPDSYKLPSGSVSELRFTTEDQINWGKQQLP